MEESGTKRHIPFGFKHFSLFSPKPSVCERVLVYLPFETGFPVLLTGQG